MRSAIKTGVVPEFKGEHFFLSNFYGAEFTWRNELWQTGEHAFQAAKAWHMQEAYIHQIEGYFNKVRDAPTPAKAKYAGRSVKIDLDTWDAQKVSYMREIIHAKFGNGQGNLVGQLINTGAMLLVEGNDWGDSFWGRCRKDGKMIGLNTLGTLLMEERGYWLHSDFKDKKNDS